MIPTDIIKKYYPEDGVLYYVLLAHSSSVTSKALSIAQIHPELDLDTTFIYEAAMLHDIGIYLTDANDIFCYGKYPYICHGFLGSDILKKEGYPFHALVCERHTGAGLTRKEIIRNSLPVPHREMLPISPEEQLICFADKFYSKTKPGKEKSVDKIRKELSKYGDGAVSRFDKWCKMFLG